MCTPLNRYCCCLLLGVLSQNTFATTTAEKDAFYSVWQKTTVSGTVVDESGLPVIGATIVAEKVEGGTITDDNGRFDLAVPEGVKKVKLRISFIT